MLGKLSLVTFTLGLVCISGSHGSIDRLIDRMMERMFIESARMSKNIANVPLPRGFWASSRIANYPPQFGGPIRRYHQSTYVPYRPTSYSTGRPSVSNNIYAPKYTINRSIQLPSMPQFANLPMASPHQSMGVPPIFRRMLAPPRPVNRFTSVKGPVLQVNLKVRPPVNKNYKKKYDSKVNVTAEVEKESVGEIVATWNTEMKEVSISGAKNETKIKTFKNTGNIHSHLGSGVEGSAHILKLRRGQKELVQTVPENLLKKKVRPMPMDETMRYKVDKPATAAGSVEPASTMPPMINLLPRQQRNVIRTNF